MTRRGHGLPLPFPVENLFEPKAGAVGRTSAANPFQYVLRRCEPQQVAQIDLHPSVERTGEENASTRIYLGAAVFSAQRSSVCALRSSHSRSPTRSRGKPIQA